MEEKIVFVDIESYLKKSQGHYMGPTAKILSNNFWIIDFRKWLRPNLRQIIEIKSVRLQSFEISHEQIHAGQLCQCQMMDFQHQFQLHKVQGNLKCSESMSSFCKKPCKQAILLAVAIYRIVFYRCQPPKF